MSEETPLYRQVKNHKALKKLRSLELKYNDVMFDTIDILPELNQHEAALECLRSFAEGLEGQIKVIQLIQQDIKLNGGKHE